MLASAEVGPTHVDVMLRTRMEFAGGIQATTSGDMRPEAKFQAFLRVQGNAGDMLVNNPLVPQTGNSIVLTVDGVAHTETFERRSTYAFQLDALIAAIDNGTPLFTDGWDGVRQMRVIDRAYTAAGLPLRGIDESEL